MKRGNKVVLLSAVAVLFFAAPVRSQQSDDLAMQITTQERLETEAWWPTKSTLPLEGFAGSDACIKCHDAENAHAPATSMQRAGVLASKATFLKDKPAPVLVSGPFTYSMAASGGGIEYSVSQGPRRFARMLDWVMGAGDLGRTFLYQDQGRWYQSQVSFYTDHAKLDNTTGLSRDGGVELSAALGQLLSADDTRRCFSCHTVHSTTSRGFNPAHAEPGLGCEACHGPALAHVTKMTAAAGGKASSVEVAQKTDYAVFNPAKLSPSDSIDFCGSCHRTFADTTLTTQNQFSTAVVRFQPYRLEESKCWRETRDARLTCVACHNPHEPLNRNVASYDRHCLQCHATVAGAAPAEHAGKVCPKATGQCVSCHMPKVNVASMHGDFTDHFIRVVQPGEGFPR